MNSESTPFIRITGLSFGYGDSLHQQASSLVIDKLDLSVAKGETLALVGPNGCGKTTLLLLMAGELHPQAGTLDIGGLPPTSARPGFVLQDYRQSLLPWFSALDNVAIVYVTRGQTWRAARVNARGVFREYAASLPLEHYPYQLSGGQQQLIAVMRAIAGEPRILLLDEPFGSLDPTAKPTVQRLLVEVLRRLSPTTVFVTHDLEEAVLLADRIAVLSPMPSRISAIFPLNSSRPRSAAEIPQQLMDELRTHLSTTHWPKNDS